MKQSFPLCKGSASSTRWLARQRNDPFVRQRLTGDPTSTSTPISYRSRSAFKLLSLNEKHPILLSPSRASPSPKVVVDLGAAPGGWSQVASALVKGKGRVFALDILDMEPIERVEVIRGDFLSPAVRNRVREKVQSSASESSVESDHTDSGEAGGKRRPGWVDTVLSDMMAPMSGVRTRDIQASLDLVAAATIFAKAVLKCVPVEEEGEPEQVRGKKVYPGGNLVLKFFAHPDLDEFKRAELQPCFRKVMVEKPKESRSESSEVYWVCLGFKGVAATPI